MAKPLAEYNAKRDFRKTAEPAGKLARRRAGELSFVIQKHAARRLHYDFRLELDSVLKSWAVAKGPSLVAGEKRLAVHVEDHPLDYGGFEGTIPQGEYGGGTVMLWDRGAWEPEGDPHEGYQKGRLTLTLDGEKLHGVWHLVRMRPRPGERRENWLLIKSDDAWARPPEAPDILDEEPLSVATGRTMEEIAAGKLLGPKVWRSNRATKPKARKATAAKPKAAKLRAPRKAARAG
jgi:bifunctional non-homologous end joining protein LigD